MKKTYSYREVFLALDRVREECEERHRRDVEAMLAGVAQLLPDPSLRAVERWSSDQRLNGEPIPVPVGWFIALLADMNKSSHFPSEASGPLRFLNVGDASFVRVQEWPK